MSVLVFRSVRVSRDVNVIPALFYELTASGIYFWSESRGCAILGFIFEDMGCPAIWLDSHQAVIALNGFTSQHSN